MPELPIRLRWVALLLVGLWVGVGFMFQSPHNGSIDPIEAATPLYMSTSNMDVIITRDGPTDLVGCVKNCWFASPSNSKVVVFRDKNDDRQDGYEWALLGQHGSTWHRTHEGSGSFTSVTDGPSPLIRLTATWLEQGTSWMYRWGILQDYVVSIGRADPDQVATVELLHNTGEVTTAKVTGGHFVSFAAADAVCEVRGRNFSGEIVERLTAATYPLLNIGNPTRSNALCSEVLG